MNKKTGTQKEIETGIEKKKKLKPNNYLRVSLNGIIIGENKYFIMFKDKVGDSGILFDKEVRVDKGVGKTIKDAESCEKNAYLYLIEMLKNNEKSGSYFDKKEGK